MGWTVYYQLFRDRVLDENERNKLGKIIGDTNARGLRGESFGLQYAVEPRDDQAIAWGFTKLSLSDGEADLEHVLAGLTRVRRLLDDAGCFASDDFDVVLWDADEQRYSSDSGEPDPQPPAMIISQAGAPSIASPPVANDDDKDEDDDDDYDAPSRESEAARIQRHREGRGKRAPRAWASGPSRPLPYPGEAAKREAERDGWTADDERVLEQLALRRDEDKHFAALATREPRAVVLAGLAKRGLASSYPFVRAVDEAIVRLRDAGGLASVEVAVRDALSASVFADALADDQWRDFLSMIRFTAALDSVADVAARMLLANDVSPARREPLARFLSSAKSRTAISALAARAREDRGRAFDVAPWRADVVESLINADRDAAQATLLLELADATPFVVIEIVRRIYILGERGKGLLDQALDRGCHASKAITAAWELHKDDDAWWRARLEHDDYRVRLTAARWFVDGKRAQADAALAAVWDAIDRTDHEQWNGYDRRRAAEHLGVELEHDIDWRAVVEARGGTWIEIAALPPMLELLGHPDPSLREEARNRLRDRRDGSQLLALSLSYEIDRLLGGQRFPPSDPLYVWDEVVKPRDLDWSAFRDMWNDVPRRALWIREYAESIAPQDVPASLRDIRARELADVVDRFRPRLTIDAADLARANDEELRTAQLARPR